MAESSRRPRACRRAHMVPEARVMARVCRVRQEPIPVIGEPRAGRFRAGTHDRRAFSLLELLIVVATLALLMAIMLPGLARSRSLARKTVCLAHLRGIGTAIHLYAANNKGYIPFGPKAPPMMTTTDVLPGHRHPDEPDLVAERQTRWVGPGVVARAIDLSGAAVLPRQ